jgi:small subunit ribosomal protein S4
MAITKNVAPAGKNAAEKQKGLKTEERPVSRNLSEYGKQLREKQKVKKLYGSRERSFRRIFAEASKQKGNTGETLLVTLERRIDNVLFRLKMAKTRRQARQMIVHGHVLINGKRVTSPSHLVFEGDVISLPESTIQKETFVAQVVDKLLKTAVKVPEWLELDKANRVGKVLRLPVRSDLPQTPVITEQLIVGLYSK